jgi:hypothetical protein
MVINHRILRMIEAYTHENREGAPGFRVIRSKLLPFKKTQNRVSKTGFDPCNGAATDHSCQQILAEKSVNASRLITRCTPHLRTNILIKHWKIYRHKIARYHLPDYEPIFIELCQMLLQSCIAPNP